MRTASDVAVGAEQNGRQGASGRRLQDEFAQVTYFLTPNEMSKFI
jgi:hypothetical protein